MSDYKETAFVFADRVRETCDAAGIRKRYESSEVPMVKAVEVLEHFGWTFDWSAMDQCDRDLYRTCWEAMAGEYYAQGKSIREKIDSAVDKADELQAGVHALRSRALKMMSSDKGGAPYIFVVPAGSTGSQKKVCITIDPNYCPAGGNGKTAETLELGNDLKLSKGQVDKSFDRLKAVHGSYEARRRLEAEIIPLLERKGSEGQLGLAHG